MLHLFLGGNRCGVVSQLSHFLATVLHLLLESAPSNKSLQLSAWRSSGKACCRTGKSRCLASDSGRQLNSMLGRPWAGLVWRLKLSFAGSIAGMDKERIIAKFGADYLANDRSYRMGIDVRLANHIAERFKGRVVLETGTGGGFTTIALARNAVHVFSVEIDAERQMEAKRNAAIAGVGKNVTFIRADIFDVEIEVLSKRIDAALIDPDWADTDGGQVYRFVDSTTQPPSDWILDYLADYTDNITLVQPPFIDEHEFEHLLPHELEKLYLSGTHELYCLHFGKLLRTIGKTEFRT
jgi:RNA cap guanine-N2 methyltransferase